MTDRPDNGQPVGQASDRHAARILQAVLDDLTRAIWNNDPVLLRQLTADPHTIMTKEGVKVFHHDDALDKALSAYSASIHALGVTEYERSVSRARFVGNDVIEGQYRSWFLNELRDVYPSFDAHMVLVRQGNRFVMREARNHVDHDQWPLLSEDGTASGMVPPSAGAFDDAEFAAFLDDISTPFSTRDITLWRARMVLPFSMVTAQGPVTLVTEEDVRRNYDLYLTAVDVLQLDTVDRMPMGFEICDENTVIATYRTELLSQGKRQAEPYTSSALLHRTPDGWKMSSIMNARGHHPWTGRKPKANGE